MAKGTSFEGGIREVRCEVLKFCKWLPIGNSRGSVSSGCPALSDSGVSQGDSENSRGAVEALEIRGGDRMHRRALVVDDEPQCAS
jgi:hypothetical protein